MGMMSRIAAAVAGPAPQPPAPRSGEFSRKCPKCSQVVVTLGANGTGGLAWHGRVGNPRKKCPGASGH